MDAGDLGARLAAGDELALQECYARYGRVVLSYLRRYVGPDDAEDVLQGTFLDVWRHAGRYDPSYSFSGWVFTLAHRRAVDSLRRRRPVVIPVEALREVVGEDGRDVAEQFAWAADVRAALGALPAAQREVLELAYFGDRTQREISTLLDVPLGTVKARMSRGTKALGRLLRGEDTLAQSPAAEGGDNR
ncbi:MAG TPA: sigma-70 family RNA polymerase sigma factor [Dermatophilaceae bacterium]|nr:sigma-70 family RNA polymerase sigma factor [Dermatophilaceae bacterium]